MKKKFLDKKKMIKFNWKKIKIILKMRKKKKKKKKKLSVKDDKVDYKTYFKCPKFRFPNAKEFEIIQDDDITYNSDTETAKGGYLMTATILEKLELRNFPLDVQHFSIIIECVDTLDQFEFYPRASEEKPHSPKKR